VVQDNFGDDVGPRNFELAERYYAASSEAEALAILRELRVRYVVVRGAGSGHGRGYGPGSMFARLHRLGGASGALGTRGAGEPLRLASLAHHRLLLDARAHDERVGESRPAYKLYEVVPGARVVGRAAPGALVSASLPVRGESRGRFRFLYTYVAEARADAEGSYALVLPYANRGAATDVRPGPRYELRSGDASAPLVLDESAVQGGFTVAGPDLSPLRSSRANRTRAAYPVQPTPAGPAAGALTNLSPRES
jgi:hypothetical protein